MRIGTPRRTDLTGKLFGRMTVLEYSHTSESGIAFWKCACECGVSKSVQGRFLLSGQTKSCGCLRKEKTGKRFTGTASRFTHGQSKTKTYGIWCGMLRRCENKNVPEYKYYGGRGISVCEAWRSFESFLTDMGFCPPGFSIERKDVNGNYDPANCIWIPRKEQSKNRRPFILKPKPSKSTKEIYV